MTIRRALFAATVLILALLQINNARAGEVTVALSANFADTAERLKSVYEKVSENRLKLISASTGKHVAQITHGAPFDIFLSADNKSPADLVKSGYAIGDSEFTYAIGKLALWSADPNLLRDNGEAVLRQGKFR